MLLALDPSSTLTGYCVLGAEGRLADAGLLKPRKAREPDPNNRIRDMVRELSGLVRDHGVTFIVIEDTDGKVWNPGGGAGLAVHGKAVGWFAAEAERLLPHRVDLVRVSCWTKGQGSKSKRAARTLAAFGLRSIPGDPGLDCVDAMGLASWYARTTGLRSMPSA